MYSSVDEYISGLETRDEIVGFLSEIEKLKETVYKTGEEGLETVLRTKVGEKPARVVREDLERSGKLVDPHFQEEYFTELMDRLKRIPVVSLELAQEPTGELLSGIRQKISEYANVPVAIDYKVTPSLMAGVRVAYGGKYFDYTVESMWPDIWAVIKRNLETRHDN